MLNSAQQEEVVRRAHSFIVAASEIFNIKLPLPAIKFDLSGRSAGMFRLQNGRAEIRFNPWIFARWYEEHLDHTVPHEVAHYVVSRLYRGRRIRPHGAEWRAVMHAFGVPPRVTCSHLPEDIADLPQRQMRRYDYSCDCTSHQLSAVRHNRIRRGQATYACRHCGGALRPATQGQ